MMTEQHIPPMLERNAECPICHKPYHNIDVWNNPIPSAKNKRAEEDLCQCRRGQEAREARRQWRMARKEEQERLEAHKTDILEMRKRNQEYWQRVEERKKEVKDTGITTEIE